MREPKEIDAPRVGTAAGRPTVRVSESMTLEFLDPGSTDVRLDADFTYEVTDPYAITIVFRSEAQEGRWTFARDLLVQGIHEPVGIGDVQLWPCLSEAGTAVVVIELRSPDGAVMVQAPTRAVSLFVQRILQVVPLGQESALLDLDSALASLFV
jgi:hypothetical protein